MSVQASVQDRYSEGAKEVQAELCCPVDYDKELLKILPKEIIDKDYGCGDPSRYVKEGDTVLDLGSGGGKICYMAAQLVGDTGQVIGVDLSVCACGYGQYGDVPPVAWKVARPGRGSVQAAASL